MEYTPQQVEHLPSLRQAADQEVLRARGEILALAQSGKRQEAITLFSALTGLNRNLAAENVMAMLGRRYLD